MDIAPVVVAERLRDRQHVAASAGAIAVHRDLVQDAAAGRVRVADVEPGAIGAEGETQQASFGVGPADQTRQVDDGRDRPAGVDAHDAAGAFGDVEVAGPGSRRRSGGSIEAGDAGQRDPDLVDRDRAGGSGRRRSGRRFRGGPSVGGGPRVRGGRAQHRRGGNRRHGCGRGGRRFADLGTAHAEHGRGRCRGVERGRRRRAGGVAGRDRFGILAAAAGGHQGEREGEDGGPDGTAPVHESDSVSDSVPVSVSVPSAGSMRSTRPSARLST